MLPTPHPEVIYKSVSEGAVLFHTGQEVYFGLNATGAKVWELLPPRCRTWEDLLGMLQRDYPEVDESTLREDVSELLDELVTHGLLAPPQDEDEAASLHNATAAPAGEV